MSWTQEQISMLIELYEEFPCLYALKNTDYHNKHKRNVALEKLVQGLTLVRPGTTSQELQKKFLGLRKTYATERKKVLESIHSGMSENEVYHPTLWYYYKMTYLNDHLQPRRSKSSFSLPQAEVREEEETQSMDSDLNEGLNDTSKNIEYYEVDDDGILSPLSQPGSSRSASRLSTMETPNTNKSSKKRKQSLKSQQDEEIEVLKDISAGLENMSAAFKNKSSQEKREKTPEDIMGEKKAQLKKIKNEDAKQDAQLKIVKLLCEAVKKPL